MLDKIKGIQKIIVLNEDNVIINLLGSAPAYVEYEEHSQPQTVLLEQITSTEQLLDSLPAEIIYVRLDKELKQLGGGVLNLTHDNYKVFVSDGQVIKV